MNYLDRAAPYRALVGVSCLLEAGSESMVGVIALVEFDATDGETWVTVDYGYGLPVSAIDAVVPGWTWG